MNIFEYARPIYAYEQFLLQTLSKREIIQTSFKRELTNLLFFELTWVIKNPTPQNIVSYIYGIPGSGKSTIALRLISYIYMEMKKQFPVKIGIIFGYDKLLLSLSKLQENMIIFKDEGRQLRFGTGSIEANNRINEIIDRLRAKRINFIFVDPKDPGDVPFHFKLEAIGFRNGMNLAYLYGPSNIKLGYIKLSNPIIKELYNKYMIGKEKYMNDIIAKGGGISFYNSEEISKYVNQIYEKIKPKIMDITRSDIENIAYALIPRRKELIKIVISMVYNQVIDEQRRIRKKIEREQKERITQLIQEAIENNLIFNNLSACKAYFKHNGISREYIPFALEEYAYYLELSKMKNESNKEKIDHEQKEKINQLINDAFNNGVILNSIAARKAYFRRGGISREYMQYALEEYAYALETSTFKDQVIDVEEQKETADVESLMQSVFVSYMSRRKRKFRIDILKQIAIYLFSLKRYTGADIADMLDLNIRADTITKNIRENMRRINTKWWGDIGEIFIQKYLQSHTDLSVRRGVRCKHLEEKDREHDLGIFIKENKFSEDFNEDFIAVNVKLYPSKEVETAQTLHISPEYKHGPAAGILILARPIRIFVIYPVKREYENIGEARQEGRVHSLNEFIKRIQE